MKSTAYNRQAALISLLYFIAAGSLTIIWNPVFPSHPDLSSDQAATILGWLMAALTCALLFLLTRSHLQRQAALELATQQARSVIENAADGIITLDDHGIIHEFNPAAAAMFGCEAAAAQGRPLTDFIPQGCHGHPVSPGILPATHEHTARCGRETKGRRADGSIFPVEITVSAVRQEPVRLLMALVRDITVRRETQQALQTSREELRSLAARLQSVREEERSRVAREVHDELGQALTGVKMDLSWILGRLDAEQTPIRERVASATQLVSRTVHAVRRIAAALRPGVLDTLGLSAALEWQASEFTAHSGIACACECAAADALLSPEAKTALFRIFQETLTNIARHAQASQVKVRSWIDGTGLHLRIEDDGVGIRPANLRGGDSLGLLGIRERASSVGATVVIQGSRGHGTSVQVSLPLPSPPGEEALSAPAA